MRIATAFGANRMNHAANFYIYSDALFSKEAIGHNICEHTGYLDTLGGVTRTPDNTISLSRHARARDGTLTEDLPRPATSRRGLPVAVVAAVEGVEAGFVVIGVAVLAPLLVVLLHNLQLPISPLLHFASTNQGDCHGLSLLAQGTHGLHEHRVVFLFTEDQRLQLGRPFRVLPQGIKRSSGDFVPTGNAAELNVREGGTILKQGEEGILADLGCSLELHPPQLRACLCQTDDRLGSQFGFVLGVVADVFVFKDELPEASAHARTKGQDVIDVAT